MATKKKLTPPEILPLYPCPSCRREHPKPKQSATSTDSGFLTAPQLCAYYGYTSVATVYSKRSRGELPPTLRGRKSPMWDSCVAAAFLHTGTITED